jgi:hypothetical protein
MSDEADGVMLRLGIFGSWAALYELSSRDSSRRSPKRCERTDPTGFVQLPVQKAWPGTFFGARHKESADSGGRVRKEGGKGSFQGLRLFVGGARKDGAQPGRRSGRLRLAGR